MFLSGRFGDGGAQDEIGWVRSELTKRGVVVYPSEDPGNLDRTKDIASGIRKCDLFVLFGQAHYGEENQWRTRGVRFKHSDYTADASTAPPPTSFLSTRQTPLTR